VSTYLIVGAKGQLGSDCMRQFDGLEIVGIDLPEVDISDRQQCFDLLESVRPEVIVNCAAYTAVDACETEKDACWRANADAPGYLAEWAGRNKSFLIHVSTDYVFPGNRPLFESLSESDEAGPVSEYGRSKLAGEQRIVDRTDRFAILRTAWLYGRSGKNFLKTMLRLTLQNPEKELKVVADQYGSPTWSETLARQIRVVAEKQAAGIFHATSEGYCNWYELACAFLEELSIKHNFVPCSTDEYPTPAKRPANSILENTRLKELGINVFKNWRDELKNFAVAHGEDVQKEVKKS